MLRVPLKAETRTFPWQDPPETKYKTILEHVDGKARPGEFIAIMGSRSVYNCPKFMKVVYNSLTLVFLSSI